MGQTELDSLSLILVIGLLEKKETNPFTHAHE